MGCIATSNYYTLKVHPNIKSCYDNTTPQGVGFKVYTSTYHEQVNVTFVIILTDSSGI